MGLSDTTDYAAILPAQWPKVNPRCPDASDHPETLKTSSKHGLSFPRCLLPSAALELIPGFLPSQRCRGRSRCPPRQVARRTPDPHSQTNQNTRTLPLSTQLSSAVSHTLRRLSTELMRPLSGHGHSLRPHSDPCRSRIRQNPCPYFPGRVPRPTSWLSTTRDYCGHVYKQGRGRDEEAATSPAWGERGG